MGFGAQDIGTFQMCFETQAAFAVITNSALVYFTMGGVFFPNVSAVITLWGFFGTILAIFKSMDLIRDVIPDVPSVVELQLQRQDHLRETIMNPKPDDPDEE